MLIDLGAVERAAADQASLKGAAGLAKPGKWSALGASEDGTLVWGACAGSGANPYRVTADLRDQGAKCTCPSRKFPCKHALALMWLRAEGLAPVSLRRDARLGRRLAGPASQRRDASAERPKGCERR